MQFGCDRLIGVGGRRAEVPRSPVEVADCAAGLGEAAVGVASVDGRCAAVDSRAHERVAEAKRFATDDDLGALGGVGRIRGETQCGSGGFDQ